jgi:hypothetical protein
VRRVRFSLLCLFFLRHLRNGKKNCVARAAHGTADPDGTEWNGWRLMPTVIQHNHNNKTRMELAREYNSCCGCCSLAWSWGKREYNNYKSR